MYDWNEPRRDEVRSTAPEITPHRSRKDRRRWCGGKEGREHVVEVRVRRDIRHRIDAGFPRFAEGCRWAIWFYTGDMRKPRLNYRCLHQTACVECGRIMNWVLDANSCPDRHPAPENIPDLVCAHCSRPLSEHTHAQRCASGKRRFWWEDPEKKVLT